MAQPPSASLGITQDALPDLCRKVKMFEGEKRMYRNGFKVISVFWLAFSFLFSTSAIGAPTTMPYLGGTLGKLQANWSTYGFTKQPKLTQEEPPSNAFQCRPPAPNDLILSQEPKFNAPVSADTQVVLKLVCKLTTPQNAVVKTPYSPPPTNAKQKTTSKSDTTKTASKKAKLIKATIKCYKGKILKTVTGKNPVCPSGYKKK